MTELNEPLIREDERTRIAAWCQVAIDFLKVQLTGGSNTNHLEGQIKALETMRDRLTKARRRRT